MWASLLLLVQDPAELVERLGSDDIEVRQRAEADLARLGPAAEAALEKGAGHDDREVASRSAHLLDVVAPHRREASAALVHLVAHYEEALSRKRMEDARALMGTLQRLDPGHALLRDDFCRVGSSLARSYSRMPDRATWASLRTAVMEEVAATPSPARCVSCVEWRLETLKVGLAFENAKMEDILAHLRDVGGVNLILDAGMSDEALHWDRAVAIEAKDVTLAEALQRLLAPYGMGFEVTEEGVVLIGIRRKAAE